MIEQQEKLLPLYAVNGAHIGTIGLKKALRASEAGEISLRTKGRGRKYRVTAAHVVYKRPLHRSPCTLTLADVERNAFALAFSHLGPTDSIRALKRATDKVEVWPEVHDTKAVCISAGRVIQPQAVS